MSEDRYHRVLADLCLHVLKIDQVPGNRLGLSTPGRAGGRPSIASSGIAIQVVAERHKAGDSIAALAKDYGRSPEEIEEAVRAELYQAA